ncbi:MAG TPA: hypothetical protein PKA27_00870 [Fimbriimonadaceae bacterium]|nr:hypothetical protein [Fimbriimonadaceae bacterium]
MLGFLLLLSQDRFIVPPMMPRRPIAKRESLPPGTTETLTVDGKEWTLFIPDKWDRKSEAVAVHFHGAIWHAIQEHLDRGTDCPLLVFYPGEGSAIYQKSVADSRVFDELEVVVTRRLGTKQFSTVDVTSFSAGYGAVREWVKQPRVFDRLRRVILADSLYGSLDDGKIERTPAKEHIVVWLPLAKAAMDRKKTFVITVSKVATPSYASSWECAAAIVSAVGGRYIAVEKGTLAATLDSEFPLLSRFDSGSFHVWQYGGEDAQAHMTHARHIAAIWKALDP